jgi:hypothetical protein
MARIDEPERFFPVADTFASAPGMDGAANHEVTR